MPPETTAESLGRQIGIQKNDYSSPWKKPNQKLITKTRQGTVRQFEFEVDSPKFEIVQDSQETKSNLSDSLNVVEILADEQEYLDKEQIIKAKGNVVIRFSNGILIADEISVNLVDRVAVAQNNVNLKRGEQILRGDRFEYYFVEDKGVIYNARGEIYQPSLSRDFTIDNGNNPIQPQPLTSKFELNQPLTRVVSENGYSFVLGSSRDINVLEQSLKNPAIESQNGGQVNRLRFQAEKVNFDDTTWKAINIRITNDPFSPPEFEIRADSAYLDQKSPYQDELITTKSRLVFDQKFSLPLFRNRLVFNQRNRNPSLFNIGFDGNDLGGLYIEREFDLYSDENILFSLTPRILIQRAFFPDFFLNSNDDVGDNGGLFEGSSYGLLSRLEARFTDRLSFQANGNLTGLDLDNIDSRLRANVKLNQKIGNLSRPHNLSLQYNYRHRLFNGSLGFRTVQESFRALISSPYIPIGNSRFGVEYQGSVQSIRAESDKPDLLGGRDRGLLTLTRLQAGASISGNIILWTGEALPATAEEGLKYTSTPVVPYVALNIGLSGVATYYSSGDSQPNLTATIGLEGQFGHFSRRYFDYTAFNVSFSQAFFGDESPFLFDRFVDTQLLSVGLTQQLYGPFRIGIQTFYNLDTSEEISTDYFLEYSRRTYNVILRYNPILEIGSINLRISDFNWEGNSTPFESGTGIKSVVDGVKIDN